MGRKVVLLLALLLFAGGVAFGEQMGMGGHQHSNDQSSGVRGFRIPGSDIAPNLFAPQHPVRIRGKTVITPKVLKYRSATVGNKKKVEVTRNVSIAETMKEIWKGPEGSSQKQTFTARNNENDLKEFKELLRVLTPLAKLALQVYGSMLHPLQKEALTALVNREYPCFPADDKVVWKENFLSPQCWEKYDIVLKALCLVSTPNHVKGGPPPDMCRVFIKPDLSSGLTSLERCVAGEVKSCWDVAENDPRRFLAVCRSGYMKYRRVTDECQAVEGTLEPDERHLSPDLVNSVKTLLENQHYFTRANLADGGL